MVPADLTQPVAADTAVALFGQVVLARVYGKEAIHRGPWKPGGSASGQVSGRLPPGAGTIELFEMLVKNLATQTGVEPATVARWLARAYGLVARQTMGPRRIDWTAARVARSPETDGRVDEGSPHSPSRGRGAATDAGDWDPSDEAVQGEDPSIVERVIVAPVMGRFRPAPRESRIFVPSVIGVEETIGFVEEFRASTPVRSPFEGLLVGMLALPGEHLRRGQPVAWLRPI
jgi:hypothetical protein